MTLWAKRTDGNHAEIRDAMRAAGAEVEDLSGSGKGVPDTLVWTPHTGLMLVEIKMPKGTLTAHQVRFHARFPVHIVRSVDDAMRLIQNADVSYGDRERQPDTNQPSKQP
jgi:hypothetical protein